MRILGISDGPEAGAALVIDDRIVGFEAAASFDGRARSRRFPWAAIDDLLRRNGLEASDIDGVSVAGRFSPPFAIRKRPGLRRLVGGPFSGALDLGVFYQAMLRQSGWGAYQADLAAEWLGERFSERGYHAPVSLVDIHTALANAAYRGQPDDDLLIVTLHPMGDGVALAVHEAHLGQIDRVFEQKGFASLHVHLERCAAALGCADARAMWRLAGDTSDPGVVQALRTRLRARNGRLSRNRYPLQERSPAFAMLRAVPRAVGAASVVENLCEAVVEVVRFHVAKTGKGRLAVSGEVFANARAVAAVAEIEGVDSVRCLANPGFGSLAIGAAAYAGGLAPQVLKRDLDPIEEQVGSAQGKAFDPEETASVLANGGKVAWWRPGQASRMVLSRADEGPPAGQGVLWNETQGKPGIFRYEAIRPALLTGSAAVAVEPVFAARYPKALQSDGRMRVVPATDPGLRAVLDALSRETGCDAVCMAPVVDGTKPVSGVVEALDWSRRNGIGQLCVARWSVRP